MFVIYAITRKSAQKKLKKGVLSFRTYNSKYDQCNYLIVLNILGQYTISYHNNYLSTLNACHLSDVGSKNAGILMFL